MKVIQPAQSLSDKVAQALRDEILGGRYVVGEALPSESVMAGLFGVSRTVMREAVSRLKADGLVSTRQGLGVFVTSVRQAQAFKIDHDPNAAVEAILPIVELRQGFEVEAAGLAAKRRTDADLAAMRAALDEMAEAMAEGNIRVGVEADVRFHSSICAASHNIYYPKLFDTFRDFLLENITVSRERSSRVTGRGSAAQAEHEALYLAIEQGDPEMARICARRHIENTRLRLMENSQKANVAASGRLKAAKPARRSKAAPKAVATAKKKQK
ncbi:FadR/GntR family transcriptional regulator [Chelativorans sp. J32]|uniref:FadR/GntR family transcriptional regulator n=1 Tax=Chelativorans sp. J32 TaxID=935840 RepID=UPI0004AF13CA|nr:FadR/GntR family transcriptional regulator [Chelativorans sp. J32]